MDTMTTMYVFDRANPPTIPSADPISADKTLMTAAVAEGRACPGFLLCPDNVTWFANGTSNWGVIGEPGSTPATHSMNMDLRYGETLDRTWNAWQNQHPTPKTDADGGNIPGPDAPYHHDAHNDWKDWVNFKYWEPYGCGHSRTSTRPRPHTAAGPTVRMTFDLTSRARATRRPCTARPPISLRWAPTA